MKFSQRMRVAALGVVAALISLGIAPAAHAAMLTSNPSLDPSRPLVALPADTARAEIPEARQIVSFGDSFTANAAYGQPAIEMPVKGTLPGGVCRNDWNNWPKKAAEFAGKSIGDWSCNGTGSFGPDQLKFYVETAIQYGDLGPGTERVVMMYGGMDWTTWTNTGEQLFNLPQVPDDYYQAMRDISARVKFVAPGAELVLLGYPVISDGDKVCLSGGEEVFPGFIVSGGSQVSPALSAVIRRAADENGAKFIDIAAASVGHDPCQHDPALRWVSGYQDSALRQMPAHPTAVGHTEIGRIAAEQMYS